MAKGKGPTAPEASSKNTSKLLGTFTAPPPLCLGDPFVSKLPIDARAQGKQIATSKLRHERSRIEPGTFSAPLLLWSESKDKPAWSPGIPYRDIYKEKKLGFGTADFPRRDEFSNTIRTSQLREILARETKMQRKVNRKLQATLSAPGTADRAMATASSILDSYSPVKLPAAPLYDVVNRIPKADLKLERDDRQAKLWYIQERNKLIEERKLVSSGLLAAAPSPPSIAQWYTMKVNQRLIDVLVNEHGQVVGQRPHQVVADGAASSNIV